MLTLLAPINSRSLGNPAESCEAITGTSKDVPALLLLGDSQEQVSNGLNKPQTARVCGSVHLEVHTDADFLLGRFAMAQKRFSLALLVSLPAIFNVESSRIRHLSIELTSACGARRNVPAVPSRN